MPLHGLLSDWARKVFSDKMVLNGAVKERAEGRAEDGPGPKRAFQSKEEIETRH